MADLFNLLNDIKIYFHNSTDFLGVTVDDPEHYDRFMADFSLVNINNFKNALLFSLTT